jgi:hypothetical protein
MMKRCCLVVAVVFLGCHSSDHAVATFDGNAGIATLPIKAAKPSIINVVADNSRLADKHATEKECLAACRDGTCRPFSQGVVCVHSCGRDADCPVGMLCNCFGVVGQPNECTPQIIDTWAGSVRDVCLVRRAQSKGTPN